MWLGVDGEVVGVVAKEVEKMPVHGQFQGRVTEGVAKGLPPSLGHLQDTMGWHMKNNTCVWCVHSTRVHQQTYCNCISDTAHQRVT